MSISLPIRDQRRSLCWRSSLAILRFDRLWITESEADIVEVLAKKNTVGQSVVYREDDHRRQDALKDRAENIEDITEQPNDDEFHAEAFGRAATEVLDDLGREDYDPRGNGNRPRKWRP